MSSSSTNIQDLEDEVSRECNYLAEVGLWPGQSQLDVSAWLANFTADEREYALYLLKAFTFLSGDMTKQLFLAALHSISSIIPTNGQSRAARWREFCSQAIVVPVEGERPNPTDSGNVFSRFARSVGFSKIMSAEEALTALYLDRARSLVFVDDFIGSGNQMITTWSRSRQIAFNGNYLSFADVASASPMADVYYAAAVATTSGMQDLHSFCAPLRVVVGNRLTDADSAVSSTSEVWPENKRARGIEVLQAASKRAGIPNAIAHRHDWRGFDYLGLCLAFEHGVPDATLPIFSWSENGWHPLREGGS